MGTLLASRPFAKALEDVVGALGLPRWTTEKTYRWWYERSPEQLKFLCLFPDENFDAEDVSSFDHTLIDHHQSPLTQARQTFATP